MLFTSEYKALSPSRADACLKSVWFWQDRCIDTCLNEDCDSDTDCGPPDERCIRGKCLKSACLECSADSDRISGNCCSNKCVDRRCYDCELDTDCSSGDVCCKKNFQNKAFCAKGLKNFAKKTMTALVGLENAVVKISALTPYHACGNVNRTLSANLGSIVVRRKVKGNAVVMESL